VIRPLQHLGTRALAERNPRTLLHAGCDVAVGTEENPLGDQLNDQDGHTPTIAGARPAGEELLGANLYAVSELIAGRAARASSARQYRAIYTRFADRLRAELGRPPVVADVSVDAIAGYSSATAVAAAGRVSPATRRGHIMMLRALLGELGLEQQAKAVRVPSHRVEPPETLSGVEYSNLIRGARSALDHR
jgi:hypothetical protein